MEREGEKNQRESVDGDKRKVFVSNRVFEARQTLGKLTIHAEWPGRDNEPDKLLAVQISQSLINLFVGQQKRYYYCRTRGARHFLQLRRGGGKNWRVSN